MPNSEIKELLSEIEEFDLMLEMSDRTGKEEALQLLMIKLENYLNSSWTFALILQIIIDQRIKEYFDREDI